MPLPFTLSITRRCRFLLAIPVIFLFLSGCASINPPDPAAATVHERLEFLARKHHVCNVAVAVIKNRRLDAVETVTTCLPAPTHHPDSVFQAASLSKPVFAYAVLKLVAQGKMALDAPVMQYLPQGYRHRFNPSLAEPNDLVSDPQLQAITVRMALNHTSGLPNWASGALKFDAAPGAKWSYSGEGYVLLQRAVEAVTGMPLNQFMSSAVFAPLAMRHSDYVLNERIAPKLVPGTRANGAPRKTINRNQPVAASSLYTTANDYGTFLAALLNDEAVLKQISASPVTVDPALGLDWGLGWGIERADNDSFIWQWGNNTGYRAFVIASSRTGDGFVMLTNSENGLALAQRLTHMILPGQHQLFQSPLLGIDLVNLLCNALRVCL